MTAGPAIRLVRGVLAWALIAPVVGCGHRVASPSPTTPARVSATASADGKPVPGIDVALSVPAVPWAPSVGGQPISVTLSMLTRRPLASATADVTVSGVLSLVGNHGADWSGVGTNDRRTMEASVRVEGLGHGEIRGTVTVAGQSEADGQGRSAVLYLLATSDEVLVGSDGPTALELRHLDHLRTSQRLSDDEYLRQRDQIISGG